MKNKIVNQEEWRKQRLLLLEKEKEFTKLRDELSNQRRDLSWVKIDKVYRFQSLDGEKTLNDLFGNNSQLIIYHFMFGPNTEQGCKICSFWADNFNSIIEHLKQRDLTMLCVSRGPIEKLEAYKKRMGWKFKWMSSINSDFNFDFHVTTREGASSEYNYQELTTEMSNEMPGISVFYLDNEGNIYHTYSCYARELESFNTAYRYLDIVPKGRDEDKLPWSMSWIKYHDEY
ncbi:MAG: thioredoxin [Flavobacteriales bacterium]|nr:DUF899 domain-containing protein [Flavobacteriales bacterium]MBN4061856.1 DUF899 domain-containing protein [Bacteroidales bacterium AH-315-I05]PCJ84043.1 MAG: thioredoxin [Flavobacteriales bacterium]